MHYEVLPTADMGKGNDGEDADTSKAVRPLAVAIEASQAAEPSSFRHATGRAEDLLEVPPRRLSICIDGGGTKCAVALDDGHGNIVRGEAGSCNL